MESLNDKLERYEKLTGKALETVSIKNNLTIKERKVAEDFMSMARNYYSDAKFFRQNGELETALAAFSYAYAWLDAGVRAGLFDGKDNDRLFTLP